MRKLKQKDVNFLLPMAKKKEINIAQLKKAGIVLLPVLLLGGCIGGWVLLNFSQQAMQLEMDDLNLKMSMMQGGNTYATAQEFQKANSAKSMYLNNLNLVSACAKTYPEMGSAFLSDIARCLTEDIQLVNMQYSAEEHKLSLYGTVRGVGDTSAFAERLRKTGRFTEITYSGWQNTQALNDDTLLSYSFQIYAEMTPRQLDEADASLLQPDAAENRQEEGV